MKKHIYEIDLIRTICCIGIIVYHFVCHTASKLSILKNTVNSNVGEIIVTVFFIVSGFVLYHSNKEITSLKKFYWKRFKSIFPSFYLCWLIFYVINVLKVRTPFYAGNPLKLLLTLIGQDGYTQLRIVNYYTVGEWFLGALIIVYALYPLLLKLHKKNSNLALLLLITLTSIVHIFDIPVISPGFPGICECCLKLYLGILIYEQIDKINNTLIAASLVYIVMYTFIRINVLDVALDIVCSICWFIVLYKVGTKLMKREMVNKCCVFISSISYQIFLLQHQIVLYVLDFHNSINMIPSLLSMILSIILTIICAYIIKNITDRLLNCKILKKIESKIID